jgi:signal peptidase
VQLLHSRPTATTDDFVGFGPSSCPLEEILPVQSVEQDPTADTVVRRGPWRIIKGIISTFAGVILAVVAVLVIVVAVSTHLSSNGQLGIAGHPVMSVLSGSMAPVINTGDLVVDNRLTAAQAASLHKGQIISFRAAPHSSTIFTHRIADVVPLPGGGVGYVTKGDANDSRDGPVSPSTNVVGLYQSKIPAGGFILNALHRPLVIGLLIASPLLWLLSEPLWKWAREEGAAGAEEEKARP